MSSRIRSRHSRTGAATRSRRSFSKTRPQRGGFSRGRRPQYAGAPRSTRRGGRSMPTFDPSQFIHTNPVDTAPEIYTPKHANFDAFGLTPLLAKTIRSTGHSSPTPIQDQIIPEILADRDVIALAETGTGKTAAFLIPLIEKTHKDNKRLTLILTPTRELAMQVNEEMRTLSRDCKLFSTTCVGGMNIRPQISSLYRTNHFIIGTPGRVLDLIKRKHIPVSKITTVVLDEADRMLDMGFITDMRSILSAVPKERETLLFSATMSKDTENIVHEFLRNPVTVSVKKKDVTDSIEQNVIAYNPAAKFETLVKLLQNPEFKRVLLFGAMKHGVEKLSKALSATGIAAESIHGNKNHSQRQRALQKFKNGEVQVLVATDVAARGIHVENVTHVINYDLPNTFEDYVHRIGRTGRGSRKGKALTFVPSQKRS